MHESRSILLYPIKSLIISYCSQELILHILIVACTLKIIMLQGSIVRLNSQDRHRDLRLDVDNMSYEVNPFASKALSHFSFVINTPLLIYFPCIHIYDSCLSKFLFCFL